MVDTFYFRFKLCIEVLVGRTNRLLHGTGNDVVPSAYGLPVLIFFSN